MAKNRAHKRHWKSRGFYDITRGQHFDLKVGPRYLFFNSLFEQNQDIYINAAAQGQEYHSQASAYLNQNKISSTEIMNSNSTNNIVQYIQFVKDLADNEARNEKAFLEYVYNFLNNHSNKMQLMTPKLEKAFSMFQEDNSNYTAIITAINEIMKDYEKDNDEITGIYQSNLQQYKELLKIVKEHSQEEYEDLEKAFYINIRTFNGKISNLLKKYIDQPNIQKLYSELLSDRIESTLYNLTQNNTFIEALKLEYLKNLKNPQAIANKLIGFVANELSQLNYTDLLANNGATLAQTIIDNFDSNELEKFSASYVQNITNLITKKKGKKEKNIVEQALSTGRGTARLLLNLEDKQDIKEFLDTYFPNDNSERQFLEKLTGIEKQDKQVKITKNNLGRASRYINKAIANKAAEVLHIDIKNSTHSQLLSMLQQSDNYLLKGTSKESFKKAIHINLSAPDAAELATAQELQQKEFVANLFTPGHTIQLKNDLVATIFFDEQNFNGQVKIQLKPKIKDIITSIPKDFLQLYREKSHGATNVAAAEETYEKVLQDKIDLLQKMLKEHQINKKEYKEALMSLSNIFTTSISVKDYHYGTNEFGFHGGTLGSNIDNILNNIQTMYDLGGISKIDTDILYFAVINCGDDTIAKDLKEPLSTFLLGAAAIMMFDDGFAASTNFLEKMKAILSSAGWKNGAGPHTLHLFKVQTGYVPASFVYSTIYHNLLQVYSDISITVPSLMDTSSNKVTINNNIHENAIPNFINTPFPQDRWDKVSEIANGFGKNRINISFSFLAGILDIFEAIGHAFDI